MILLLSIAVGLLYGLNGHLFFVNVNRCEGDPDGALAAFHGRAEPCAVWASRTLWCGVVLLWPLLHAGAWVAGNAYDLTHSSRG